MTTEILWRMIILECLAVIFSVLTSIASARKERFAWEFYIPTVLFAGLLLWNNWTVWRSL